MKPVYMCEYCDKMGNARTIVLHEQECIYNPKNRFCYTCKYAKIYRQHSHCVCTKNAVGDQWVAIGTGARTCWENGRTQKYTTP